MFIDAFKMLAREEGFKDINTDIILGREIGFLDIPRLIETAMNAYTSISDYTLDDVLEADKWAREYTSKMC